RRGGDVIGIAREPVANQLGVDFGAARLGVLEGFEHDHAGALAHYEAVAVLVIGPRGARRLFVEGGRERAQRREAGERNAVDRRFGAAGQHHVGVAEHDHAGAVADRVRAGRSGGDDGMIGTLEPEFDRDVAGGEIDDAAGNEERRYPARALLVQGDRDAGDALDAADAGADQHAGAGLLLMALRMPAGVVERLTGSAHGKGDELIDLALLLRLHPLVGIVGGVGAIAARNLAGDPAGEIGDLEALDLAHAAFALDEARPSRLDAAAERRDRTHAGDDDPLHERLRAQLRAPTLRRAGHSSSANRQVRLANGRGGLAFSFSRFFREI